MRTAESKGEGVRSGARGAGREAEGRGYVGCGASGVHDGRVGPTQGLGVRARAERTLNISAMVVTLEVTKLLSGWLNAGVDCAEPEGGERM